MDAPQCGLYNTEDSSPLLPDVRDLLNRRRDHAPDPERLALELGCAVHAVEWALEALAVEGEVLA